MLLGARGSCPVPPVAGSGATAQPAWSTAQQGTGCTLTCTVKIVKKGMGNCNVPGTAGTETCCSMGPVWSWGLAPGLGRGTVLTKEERG